MATLGLKDCKELVIFRALTEHERFLDACKMVMEFDKTHPDRKVFRKSEDREILRKCFEECRQALAIAFPRGEKADFDNVSHLNRFRNVFNQQLPKGCQKYSDNFTSAFSGKIGMGKIFVAHMDYIDRAGLLYYKNLISEQKRDDGKRTTEQVVVRSYRPLRRGYGDKKVFSDETTYKTRQEMIRRKIAEEKRKGIA